MLVKPDMLAVCFGLAGLVVALYSLWGGERASLWWALPLFWAAFFTKQTALAPALAVCVWLLLQRLRTGLPFSAIYIGFALGVSQLLNWWTAGGYYYHELTLHDLPWDGEVYLHYVQGLFGSYWPLLGLGALTALGYLLAAVLALTRAAGGFGRLIRKIGSFRKIEAGGWAAPVILLVATGSPAWSPASAQALMAGIAITCWSWRLLL